MTDTLYKNVEELVNEYNSKLIKHGIEITLHRRSFKEEVKAYSYQSQHSFLNMFEYIFITKKIEEKKYPHIPTTVLPFCRCQLIQNQRNCQKRKTKKRNIFACKEQQIVT